MATDNPFHVLVIGAGEFAKRPFMLAVESIGTGKVTRVAGITGLLIAQGLKKVRKWLLCVQSMYDC